MKDEYLENALKALGYKEPTNEEMSELHDLPPVYAKPNLIKKISGWIRLNIWGVCPECNHDAPELYDCRVCGYYRYLPRYRDEQTKKQKVNVWNRFLVN